MTDPCLPSLGWTALTIPRVDAAGAGESLSP